MKYPTLVVLLIASMIYGSLAMASIAFCYGYIDAALDYHTAVPGSVL